MKTVDQMFVLKMTAYNLTRLRMLGRVRLHRAVVIPIEGNSYWLHEHTALTPENMRTRGSILDPAGAQPVKRRPQRPLKEVRESDLG